MSDEAIKSVSAPGAIDPIERPNPGWRELWQVPAAVAAVGLLIGGIAYAFATRPDPDFAPVLKLATEQIERAEFPKAILTLNTRILPYVGRPALPPEEEAEFHRLIARAVFGGQRAMGLHTDENFRNALSEMRAAEAGGAKLTDQDRVLIAECYMALGEIEAAGDAAERISAAGLSLKIGVNRSIVDRYIGANPPQYDEATGMLAGMAEDPKLPTDDRAWAIGRQAGIEIDQGRSEDAITRILRSMPRLDAASPIARARLHLLLSNAYLKSVATDEAERQLELAGKIIPEGSPEQSEAQLLLARVLEQRDDFSGARDEYHLILDRVQPDETRVIAQRGLAVMEATLGEQESAQQVFGDLVAQVRAGEAAAVGHRDEILESLLSIFRDQIVQEDIDVSFRYAELAGQLYPIESSPARVIEALAIAHRVKADRVEELAPKVEGPLGPEMDPSTEREVQRLRMQAAAYYRMHARFFVVTDIEAYADSLWQSGVLYDGAGDQEEAIAVFRQFARDLPTDVRQPEARYRLAQALSARGLYLEAEELYRGLIDDRDRGLNMSGLGRFADLSHVPLAQMYLLDGDESNDEAAELLLGRVLNGDIGGPDNQNFVPALTVLSELWSRRGEYARAIEGFEEALARTGTAGSPGLRFKLADAYRLNAKEVDRQLESSLTDKDRKLLTQTRHDQLVRAMELYESARQELEDTHPQRRDALANLQLRNSYFYLGDCAFDLGDTSSAVKLYNTARERYPSDPASLVALVQIVNAYVTEGNFPAARTANERARLFYEGLPAEVWDDPNLPMSRSDWERWLASSSMLYADGNEKE